MDAQFIQNCLANLDKLTKAEQDEIWALLEDLDKAELRQRCADDFMCFVKQMWPAFIEGAHHKIMAQTFGRVADGTERRTAINLGPRHCLEVATPILTTSGWKTMATIRTGDEVYGIDGLPALVTGKSEVYCDRRLWLAKTDDGAEILCDDGHLWTVSKSRKRRDLYETVRTTDLVGLQRKPMLPPCRATVGKETDLPVDPYCLGVWLGDGSSAQAVITMHDNDAPIVRARIEASGLVTTDQKTRFTFGILNIKTKLLDMGVLGNKHIPAAYLRASVEQRHALLDGLMDTDGNVSKDRQCFIATSSKVLMEQYRELLYSLGIKNGLSTSRAVLNGRDYGETYRVGFYAVGVGTIPRKRDRTTGHIKKTGRYISFSEAGTGNVQCIEIDRPDGLFLAGHGLIPTHNTKSEFTSYLLPAWYLGKYPHKKVIQCSHTAELAVGFGRKVRNLVGSKEYQDIFPDVRLSPDSKAAGRWSTNKGGEYFAIGVGGSVTGKGADILIIDDPHALEVSTPIPTMNGFVEIQHLKIGDQVFGPDGKPTTIIGKSDIWHDRDLYSVATSDGQEIICDGGHLWGINSDTCIARSRVDSYATRYLSEWPKMNAPIIPRHQAVEYSTQELPIDPWVLGAWLGDGTSSSGRITAHPDDQPYMIEQFARAGYDVGGFTKCGYTFTVYGLMPRLRALGVLNNKHVPEQYLLADTAQRLALLQGLVDTDGSVTKVGQCAFHNSNKAIATAVTELLHSLGVKAQLRTYEDNRGRWKSAKPKHRVVFKLQDAARMPRKAMYTRTPMDKLSRSISVEPTGTTGSVQCITVDRKDGLFLAGRGYVVTHNSEQEAALAVGNPGVYDHVWEWYSSGPRQRLQPGASLLVVMTRWSKRDLTGRLLQSSMEKEGSDEWNLIELPAILDEDLPSERPLWPEFWPIEQLRALRAELPVSKWKAQYQQEPTSESGALLKRDWWRDWVNSEGFVKDPPKCKFVLMAGDTAFTQSDRSDFSAFVTFGVFEREGPNGRMMDNLILLDAWAERLEFPELKEKVRAEIRAKKPDTVIIEAKASGSPLIQELRMSGIPIQDFTPVRGKAGQSNDKIARTNSVTDILASGMVWACKEHRYAADVIDACAEFPNGDHDDLVDCVVMALTRFRAGGFIQLTGDDLDEEPRRQISGAYY